MRGLVQGYATTDPSRVLKSFLDSFWFNYIVSSLSLSLMTLFLDPCEIVECRRFQEWFR